MTAETNWKLKLKYGKLKTDFKHFTTFADGIMENENNEFDAPLGTSWMAMKNWATDADESADMMQYVSKQIGFNIKCKIEIYESDPVQPPKDKPFGYDINFTPYG